VERSELFELPEFSVTTAGLDGAIVVSVSGELDMSTAPQLKEALVACDGNQPVVVDVTALDFIDSSGLHVLFGERGSRKPAAVVIDPESDVARVFDIVCANKALFVCHDLETAIKSPGVSRLVREEDLGRWPRASVSSL
jgi:anti-anti-sigma factor